MNENGRSKPSIPPPITGYWAWVREELKTKADEKWVISELKSLKRMFDDTKVTAKDAKTASEKPYRCSQEGEIEKLKMWQFKVTNWKIPAIVSIVVLVISAAGQYFSLKDSVEDGNQAREQVQKTLKVIEAKQDETSEIITEMKIQQARNEELRKEELEDFVKQVSSETKADLLHTKKARVKKRDL